MLFDFEDMFLEWGRPFTKLVPGKEGYWDEVTGKYVPPTEPEDLATEGIVLPLNDEELRFEDGGTFTMEDRKVLYRGELTIGQVIIADGEKFKILRSKPYKSYAGFTVFYGKKVKT